MASSFVRTIRSLEGERRRRRWPAAVLALALLAGWGAWLGRARVIVYATSSKGRLEVAQLVYRVAAPDAGRVTELHVALGRFVHEGDLLVALDTTMEQRKKDEATVHLAGLEPRIAALRDEIDAEEKARTWQSKANLANLARARVEAARAESRAKEQDELLAIQERLRAQDLASAIDTLHVRSEADDRRLNTRGARVDVGRLHVTSKYDDELAKARIADLERQVAELTAERDTTRAAIDTAVATIALKTVRAPSSGRLGNIAAVQVGEVVHAGDVLATVVPSQEVHVVAEYTPAEAVGRILPGQQARIRLSGFAWSQYGLLHATVKRVASEPRDGTIRVEMDLEPDATQSIPVQHGLPGVVEVEVERVAAWKLLLRSAGYALAGAGASTPTTTDAPSTPAEASR
jgi:membrane fusion protein (multidrug efflux system)